VLKPHLAGLGGETIVSGLGLFKGPWANENESKSPF